MNQSPTIYAPTKRTDEVDWANPLKRYIQTTYQEDPEKYADEANTIQRLRQDMRGAGKDLTGRDLLYRYYGQLELLELRFPVDENHIRISFTWYDAFTLKPTSQHSLAYEKASTIFNIASVLSAIAASQNRSENDGYKLAFNFFQASAERYKYINDNFLHAPSTDLSRETVKLLSQLMLMQAQECFLEQSVASKKKPALTAKLAAQAGWSYGNIVENMGDLVSRSVFDKSWLTVCQIKHKYFGSMAQHQKALSCEAEAKYGECVGRLVIAETLAKEASKLSTSFISSFSPTVSPTLPADAAISLQELTKSNLALITEKKVSATRDNDIIYHEVVPQESVILPIEKLGVATPTPIQSNEIQKFIGPDIFQRLIPISVHESASLYSEEKAKIVRCENERCDIANGELEAALEYMKLPGVLDKFRNSNNSNSFNELAEPNTEVKQWAQLIKEEEDQKGTVKELMTKLDSLKNKSKEFLDDVTLNLDAEQRECEIFRVKYSDAWTQSPSGPLTAVFRQDLRDHRNSLDQATNSDRHLYHRYEQVSNDVVILRDGGTSEELEKVYVEALASTDTANETTIPNNESLLDVDTSSSEERISTKLQKVEECLSNLQKVKKERMDTLSDLKEETHQDDISHLLILNKKTQNIEPQLFATELEKFTPYRNRITASIHHQQALLQELTGFYKALMEGEAAKSLQMRWDQAERRRKEIYERFKKAKDGYLEVKEGLRKGIQFYMDLADLIESLSKNVRQFAQTRKQERNELVHNLDNQEQQRLSQEQQRLKEQLEKFATAPNSQTVNTHAYEALALANLAEETSKLSINNKGELNLSPTATQTQSNNFHTSSLQPYAQVEQNSSAPSHSVPVSYAAPSAPPKPIISPLTSPTASTNYYSPTLTRQPSLSSGPPYTPAQLQFTYQSNSTPLNSQGPPVPPLPSGYQQQSPVTHNPYQPISRTFQAALPQATTNVHQQPPHQQAPVLLPQSTSNYLPSQTPQKLPPQIQHTQIFNQPGLPSAPSQQQQNPMIQQTPQSLPAPQQLRSSGLYNAPQPVQLPIQQQPPSPTSVRYPQQQIQPIHDNYVNPSSVGHGRMQQSLTQPIPIQDSHIFSQGFNQSSPMPLQQSTQQLPQQYYQSTTMQQQQPSQPYQQLPRPPQNTVPGYYQSQPQNTVPGYYQSQQPSKGTFKQPPQTQQLQTPMAHQQPSQQQNYSDASLLD